MTKKIYHKLAVALFAIAVLISFCACSDETNEDTHAVLKQNILKQYVSHVISPTYSQLAAQAEQLVFDLQALRQQPTDAHVQAACATFLEARACWEKSEAFLFGPASDFGIDPHIDSWPLDEDAFNIMMANDAQINAMDNDEGDVYAGDHLGNSLLGFHGLEYILFENGSPKPAASISDKELVYAIAVAGDLRNHCYQLEVSWMGDEAPAAHVQKVEELEYNSTVNGSNNSYGDNMVNAGTPGSTYASTTNALMSIIDGCNTIVDEVGTSKIGKPYHGEDIHYIESPYSQKSIQDFYDNIISVQNAYMGGVEGERNSDLSVHYFINKLDAAVDSRVLAAIDNSLAKIAGMKAPFVQNYTDATAKAAIDALAELDDALSAAYDVLRNE